MKDAAEDAGHLALVVEPGFDGNFGKGEFGVEKLASCFCFPVELISLDGDVELTLEETVTMLPRIGEITGESVNGRRGTVSGVESFFDLGGAPGIRL